MKVDKKIWRTAKLVGLLLFVVGGIVLAEYQYRNIDCKQVKIKLEEDVENVFLTEENIIHNIRDLYNDDELKGKLIHIDAERMESKLKNNIFVKDAEILKTHKGQLLVSLSQEVPVFRLMTEKQSCYISEGLVRLPLSAEHSARLMMVRCKDSDSLFVKNPKNSRFEKKFLSLVAYINQDEFLKAQLCAAWIDVNKELTFYPQVTSSIIAFGKNENYKDKFERIKIFYNQILPRKGWNSYKKVSVKFNNQIVCE